MKELTRRSFLKYTGAAAAAAAVASVLPMPAFADDDDDGMLVAPEGTEFKELDSATMGIAMLLASLTPFRNTSYQRGPIIRYLFDRLAYLTAEGEYVPQGAKAWSVEDDGVTWNVEIYDYITDSQGNHITVDDIIWFINTSVEKSTKPCFNKIASMEKVDDYNMKIIMKQDLADAFGVILESTFLISQAAYEASDDEMNAHVVSTSPYVIKEFVADNKITFTKRDDFWQDYSLQDPTLGANVKEVTQILISEASQQQIALETGTIDIMPGINSTIVDAFVGNSSYVVSRYAANNNFNLCFSGDPTKLIANDLNLRKAICYAIDVNTLILGAANGYAEPAYDFIPRVSGGFQEKWMDEEYFPYDLAKAQECLKASSYNGEELTITGTNTYSMMFTIIQACCMAVGINLKLNLEDMAIYSKDTHDGRLWDMEVVSTGNGGANMWTQFFDGDAYEYGDSCARQDAELNEMIHYTWQNANYTPENIDKVHRYLTDNCIAYGLYLPQNLSVTNTRLGMVETHVNGQGLVDIVACKFA